MHGRRVVCFRPANGAFMMGHQCRPGRSRFAAVVIAAALSAAGPVRAATSASWTTAVSGLWTDASKWSTNPNYPNNGTPGGTTYDAGIAASGAAYEVTFAGIATVDSLTLNSADATLRQNSGDL